MPPPHKFALFLLAIPGLSSGQSTPATAIQLGTLTAANSPLTISVPAYAAGALRWYRFTLSTSVDSSANTLMSIRTSSAGDPEIDTEIGLYTAAGVLVSNDDDEGDDLFSLLTFGLGGDNGSLLAAGEYYLVTGRYDTQFNGSGFSVSSTGPANMSPYNMTLSRGSNVPTPQQSISGSLNLGDVVNQFAMERVISYVVQQGTTTVTSGAMLAGYASTPFILTCPQSFTGSATITFDGGPFLKRVVSINLTGTESVVGPTLVANGDVDNSGEVDAADIDAVIARFGASYPGGPGNGFEDVDSSGEVDAADIDIVISKFGAVND